MELGISPIVTSGLIMQVKIVFCIANNSYLKINNVIFQIQLLLPQSIAIVLKEIIPYVFVLVAFGRS